ncbi:MAG: Sensor histidine kinase TodS [Verrucomicrobia subdivision 3 bacterium]|nr:Sensor histidine kinase TodS [Limisphaerales bacterium]MCS1413220.1 Sensor histidine kinase TodS [Limisphaerales bacterium]
MQGVVKRDWKAVDRCKQLVRQILMFSRKESFKLKLINLNSVLKEAVGLLRPVILTSIRFETQIGPGLPMIFGDHMLLQQVLLNMATNVYQSLSQGERSVNLKLRCEDNG